MKKKILFIVSEDWYFLSHRLSLAKFAIEQGFEVELICNCNEDKKKIEYHGIRVIEWKLNRKSYSILSAIKSLIQLNKTLTNSKPDLIYAVAIKPVLFTSILAKIQKKENVIYAMGGLGFSFSSNKIRAKFLKNIFIKIFKFCVFRNQTLILQNNDDAKIFYDRDLSNKLKIEIIRGSGIDINKFKFSALEDTQDKKVILPSRMLWDKGISDFIECAKRIKENFNVKFILVGEPDDHNPESISRNILKSWQDNEIVEWWGHQQDMVKVYRQSTIVCLPSFREGLPKVLLEAGSIGRPLVSYDVPGCREVIINNENGLLVPFREIKHLSNAISKLLNDIELCKKFGLNGRKIIEDNFVDKIIFKKIANIWHDTLKINS